MIQTGLRCLIRDCMCRASARLATARRFLLRYVAPVLPAREAEQAQNGISRAFQTNGAAGPLAEIVTSPKESKEKW